MRTGRRAEMTNIMCPNCYRKNIIKYGRYKGEQAYFCKVCKKKFMKQGFKNKTYPPKVVTNAITCYNLGNTFEESAKLVNKRFKVKVSKSSVHSWVKEFSDICTYAKLRPQIVRKYTDRNIIFAYSFLHSGLTYDFKYHLPKLDMFCNGFPSLLRYLRNMQNRCPSDIFKDNERCSRIIFEVKVKKAERYNQACRLAGFALEACNRNRERHNVVEEFMLVNDSSTVASEVPIWFWEKNLNLGVCGHIDIMQIRQGKIFILDFKPGADKEKENKVASQLYLYASGLSFRTGIPLSMFRCAWFDETVYYEFCPAEIKIEMKRNNLKRKVQF